MRKTILYKGLISVILILAMVRVIATISARQDQEVGGNLIPTLQEAGGMVDPSLFARPFGPKEFNFPEDQGSHEDFQTEWWYYTGNLLDNGGRHFGYQLTFFRRGLLPPGEMPARRSAWASTQVYMAHFAITDVTDGNHLAFQRLSRGAIGLSGARGDPYRVWLDDWSIEEIQPGVYHLVAKVIDPGRGLIAIDLNLTDSKGFVLQGDQGYSRKGAQPGQASYYISQTRLQTIGTLSIGKENFHVSGLSWMDHEFSTSALAIDQVGWDWFALQLDNKTEVMVYQIRNKDGSIDPYSSGSFISPSGEKVNLSKDDFEIQVKDYWTSPKNQAIYPSRWIINIPSAEVELEIMPWIADQELDLDYVYWEGAVSVRGTIAGVIVGGNGYVELTGYAGSMGGEF